MSNIVFTVHDVKNCEICNEKMIELKVSEYHCVNCGYTEDSD